MLADMKDQQLLRSRFLPSLWPSLTAVGWPGYKSRGLPFLTVRQAAFAGLQPGLHHGYNISCRFYSGRSSHVLLMQYCHACMLD